MLLQLMELAGAFATLHGQGVYLGFVDPGSVVIQASGRVGFSKWPTLSGQINLLARVYQAPEITRGQGASPAGDVYSLGVMLRQALTGSTSSTATAHSKLLQAIVDRATAREAAQRFGDAREFLQNLEAALKVADGGGSARLGPADDVAQRLLQSFVSLQKQARKAKQTGNDITALQLEQRAERVALELTGTLRAMVALAPADDASQGTLAELARLSAVAAERRRDPVALEAALDELRLQGRPEDAEYLRGEGVLTLESEPPDAKVSLFRVREDRSGVAAEPFGGERNMPLEGVTLPAGTWVARIQRGGCHDVTYPFHLERMGEYPPGKHPSPAPLPLLKYGSVKTGEAYVPGGVAIFGGDPHAPNALERRTAWISGFVIQSHPVTFEAYMVFLNELVAQRRLDEVDAWMPMERLEGGHREPVYNRGFAGKVEMPSRSERSFVGPHAPVVLVTVAAAEAYALWYSVRSRKRWRLPTEAQWEKAARGADGRWYPWGDVMHNRGVLTATTGGDALPDVRQAERDVNAYGVTMMAGAVREWTSTPWTDPEKKGGPFADIRAKSAEMVVKGSSVIESADYARCAARGRAARALGWYDVGFRLVREVN